MGWNKRGEQGKGGVGEGNQARNRRRKGVELPICLCAPPVLLTDRSDCRSAGEAARCLLITRWLVLASRDLLPGPGRMAGRGLRLLQIGIAFLALRLCSTYHVINRPFVTAGLWAPSRWASSAEGGAEAVGVASGAGHGGGGCG